MAESYVDADYLARSGPLDLLRLGQAIRTALRAYDNDLVTAARQQGATWQDVGDAVGMARTNAQRKWSHVGGPAS